MTVFYIPLIADDPGYTLWDWGIREIDMVWISAFGKRAFGEKDMEPSTNWVCSSFHDI